jgi:death-on-curing protein
MINIDEVGQIHQVLVDNFGGSNGLRDVTALQSALARPFQKYNNLDLYPTVLEKVAAILESILTNHPFVDGNKRTGYTVMRLYLLINGFDIEATTDEKYEFIMNIASGTLKYQEIVVWLRSNIK